MNRPEANMDNAQPNAVAASARENLIAEAFTVPAGGARLYTKDGVTEIPGGTYSDKPAAAPTVANSDASASAAASARQKQGQDQTQGQSQAIDGSGNSTVKNAGNSSIRVEGSRTFVAPSAPTIHPGENTSSSTYLNTGDQVLQVSGTAANRTGSGAIGVDAGLVGVSISGGGSGPDGKAMDTTVKQAVEIQRDAAGTFFGRQAVLDNVAPAAGAELQATIVNENLSRHSKPAEK